MFNVGDEVVVIDDTDNNKTVINKVGKIIAIGDSLVSVFFYTTIDGHNGIYSQYTLDTREELAVKHCVKINNCWNFPNSDLYLSPANNKIKLKTKLLKLANC